MAQETINIGSSPNRGDGDPTRTAFNKVNLNFTELYGRVGTLEEGPGTGTTVTQSIIGNVYSEDSTLMVDAVNGTISYSVLSGAPTNLSDFNNDLDYAVIVGSTLQTNGLPTGMATQELDISGSVFADDSTLLVDAVNGAIPYSVISDVQVTESDLLVDFAAVVATQITSNGLPVNTRLTGNLDADGNWILNVASIIADADGGAFSITGPTNSNIVFSVTTNGVAYQQSFFTPDGNLNIARDLTVNGEIVGYVSLDTLKTEVAAAIDFADFQSRIAAL